MVGGLVLIGFGILFVNIAIHFIRKINAARNWPTTIGKVVSSEGVGGWSRGYEAKVLYEYSVGGTAYSSDKISLVKVSLSFGGAESYSGKKADAQRIVETYPPGEVVVHYNPDKPHIAVLEPGTQETIEKLTIAACPGLVFIGAGVLIILGIL